MKKNHIAILLLSPIFCCGVLWSLYAVSPISKEIFRGSFKRNFLGKAAIIKDDQIDLEFNSFYLAGKTDNAVYLGNYMAPAHLLIVDYNLKDTSHVRLAVAGIDTVPEPKIFRLSFFGNNYFMSHGNMPIILKGRINEWVAAPFINDSAYYFVEAIPISSKNLAIKSYHRHEQSYELAKKTTDSLKFNIKLLNKQIDGAFCVDGHMVFDQKTSNLAYIHYYRNELIVIDTNLNLKYRSHTLDTFSHARIKVSKVNSDGSESMLAAPPAQLNGLCYADNGKLYIHSNILADNEVEENFINDTVIDVYDLTNKCAYLYSFYIPSVEGHKPSSILIRGNKIFAVFDHYLTAFKIESDQFI